MALHLMLPQLTLKLCLFLLICFLEALEVLQSVFLGSREETSHLGLYIILEEDLDHVNDSVLLLVLSPVFCDATQGPNTLQVLFNSI